MSKKKGKKKGRRDHGLTKALFTLLEKNPEKKYSFKEIASNLNLRETSERNKLIALLGEFKAKGKLKEPISGRFMLATSNQPTYNGTIDMTQSGNAYVVSEEVGEDLFIHKSKLKGALHKDEVRFSLHTRGSKSKPEAKVIDIEKRYKTRFVGEVEESERFYFIKVSDNRMAQDIFVAKPSEIQIQEGDKVVVEIVVWGTEHQAPEGKVIENLGQGDYTRQKYMPF
jgi:exoribonuclease R